MPRSLYSFLILPLLFMLVNAHVPLPTTSAPIRDPELKAIDMIEKKLDTDFQHSKFFPVWQKNERDELDFDWSNFTLRLEAILQDARKIEKNVTSCAYFAVKRAQEAYIDCDSGITQCVENAMEHLKKDVISIIKEINSQFSTSKNGRMPTNSEYETAYSKRTQIYFDSVSSEIRRLWDECNEKVHQKFGIDMDNVKKMIEKCIITA